MNLICWDQNVYRPLAGSYAIFGAVIEMKALARWCLNNGQALQMPARHCNKIVRSLGHINILTPIKPDSCKHKTQFLSEQYYQVRLQNCYTMLLKHVILCNRYIYIIMRTMLF